MKSIVAAMALFTLGTSAFASEPVEQAFLYANETITLSGSLNHLPSGGISVNKPRLVRDGVEYYVANGTSSEICKILGFKHSLGSNDNAGLFGSFRDSLTIAGGTIRIYEVTAGSVVMGNLTCSNDPSETEGVGG